MTQPLSAQNLIKCLFEKDKYKATQSYLHEVALFNETVYEMFNKAMQTVLLKPNHNYMSKLMALRLFKQLVVCANFTLIDGLDENIEDLILAAAQYNKKNKQVSRGANYFIDVDKQKKDAEIQKIGATFVLLASQILVVLGKWHPVQDDGQESRFAQYLKELQIGGIPLPQENQLTFFKKEDQDKFRKNYSNWVKWYVQKVKQEEVQETTRQIKQQTHQHSKVQEKLGSKFKIDPPSVNSTLNVQNGDPLKPQNCIVNVNQISSEIKPDIIKEVSKQAEKQIPKQSQKQKLQYEKQKEEIIRKYQRELAALRNQNDHIKRQVNEATDLMSKTYQQKVKLEQQLNTKKKEISLLAQEKQDLEGKMTKLSQLENNGKQTTAECFQIRINPPKAYEQLEQQNDILQGVLEATEQHFVTKKRQLQEQLEMKKEQNTKLAQTLQQKEEQIKKWKQERNIERQLVTNIIKEDSLVVTDQIKFTPLQNKRQSSTPKENTDLFSKTCSMSEYLRNNQKNLSQNVEPKVQARNRSLRKTQSTHKMSTINNCQNFYTTTVNFTKAKVINQKLSKTSNTFYHKRSFESTNSLITIFPYLQNYFPVLPQESRHFKTSCFDVKNKLCVCYENEIVKVSLKKINWSKYIVTVSNKLNTELKIKMTSEHRTFVVEGQKYRKIKPFSSEQMQVSNLQFDINLRYLSLNFVTGNQKISLTNSNPFDRTFTVPLPITILDFCKLNAQNTDCFSDNKTNKYCSNKLSLGSLKSNFIQDFRSFKLTYNATGLSAKTVAELYGEPKAKVMIEIQQMQCQACVSAQFISDSYQSANLAKVMLQLMLFLIQQ